MSEKKFLSLFFYITLFCLCFVMANYTAGYDFDLWARLIVGKVFWATGEVLKYDFLSYTPTHPWYDHEWGSGVFAFYPMLKFFGVNGLIILQALFLYFTFFFCIKTIKLRAGGKYSHYILPLLLIMFVYNQCVCTPVRCQMFSFTFIALIIYLLERARAGKNKTLWIIPLLTIIWNNLHGGVVAGLGIIFLYAIGEFLCRRPFKKYLLVLGASLPLLVINPYGLEYLKFLFMANTMIRHDIIEWWTVFHPYHINKCIPIFIFTAIVILAEGYAFIRFNTGKKIKEIIAEFDYTKWILLIVTFYIGYSHVKLLPICIIVATCYCYQNLCKFIPKNPLFKVWAIIFVYILMGVCLIIKPSTTLANYQVYPLKEVEFIRINNLTGNLMASFGQGSYVSYKLFPHNKIYMDGRYEEVYDNEILMDLKVFYEGYYAWGNILKKYDTDVILLPKEAPIYKELSKYYPAWQKVYEGKLCGVFVKNPKHLSEYKLPSNDLKYYEQTMFDTDMTEEFLKKYIPEFMKSDDYNRN